MENDVTIQQEPLTVEDNEKKFKRFFMNPKEEYVCSLGNGYIQNFLARGFVGKGFAIVSDKRVYFNGKTYEVRGRKLKSVSESRTVDLKDVSGTGVRSISYPLFWILAIVAAVLAVAIPLIVGLFDYSHSDYSTNLSICAFFAFCNLSLPFYISYFLSRRKGFLIAALVFTAITIVIIFIVCSVSFEQPGMAIIAILIDIPAVVLLVSYFKSRITLLTISYAGGCIAFDINWYSNDESDYFQRMLRIAKDKAVEDAENATANAMREVMSTVVAQPSQNVQAQASAVDELMKYAQLYKDGLLSEEEFAVIKTKLL